MTTITELSTSELVKENSNFYDPVRNVDIINLNYYLTKSFNEYIFHITENNLKLSRTDKNKLGIHFIIKEVIRACKSSKYKKFFYYKVESEKTIEESLVRRIFNSLTPNILYDNYSFSEFVSDKESDYHVISDKFNISLAKFRKFLKKYELKHLEAELLNDMNVKLSLMT
jgi:hypothetical protein